MGVAVQTANRPGFVAMDPKEFADHMKRRWRQGEHVALVGPTGVGKSTMAHLLLPLHRYVLAFDPKGGDDTLAKLKNRGFVRVPTWPPPRKIMRQIEEDKGARLIVGAVTQTKEDIPRLRQTIARALDDAFDQGGWVVYVDELQVAADPKMMNLMAPLERMLVSARSKGISVVSSFQRPANVPRAASDQAAWFVTWATRDTDVVARLGEMAGRPRHEMRGIMKAIGEVPHSVAVFSRNPYEPVILTRARRV